MPRSSQRILLFCIVLLGAAVRFYGLDFALLLGKTGPVAVPFAAPDEEVFWITAVRFFATGDLNPHTFIYPTLYTYALASVYFFYFLFRLFFSFHGSVEVLKGFIAMNPSELILVNRMFVAAIGTLTLLVIYRLGKELGGRTVGLLAAFFLSLAYLHVQYSHFGVSDVPVTFMMCLSFYFILKIYKKARWRDYLLAGVFTGLAASTKWVGFMNLLPLVTAHVLNCRRRQGEAFFSGKFLFALLFIPAMFFLGSPYCALSFGEFSHDAAREMRIQTLPTHAAYVAGKGLWRHVSWTLWRGMGWPVFLASAAGFIFLFRKSKDLFCLFAILILPVYFLVAPNLLFFTRYLLPIIPFLCVLAAFFLRGPVYAVPPARRAFWFFVTAVVLAALPAQQAFFSDRKLKHADSRITAAEWIGDHLEKGKLILLVGNVYGVPALYPMGLHRSERFEWPARFLGTDLLSGPDYKIAVLNPEGYFDKKKKFKKNFLGYFDYVIVDYSPHIYGTAYEPVFNDIKEQCRLMRLFKGGAAHKALDFYVSPQENPGPDIYVFKSK